VILQLPLFIVEFVALYCLGILSEIYRNAKRSQLNVYKHFHSAMAKMMIAEMGFRGLMGGAWHGSVLKLSLTEQGVFEHLSDVFGDQIDAGTLQKEELQRMVAVTFRHIDADGTGTVTCGEFITSFMASELITVPTMARYFDDDVKVSPLRVLLDSSWHQRAHDIKLWKASHQEQKETESLKGGPLKGGPEINKEIPSGQVSSEEPLAKTVKDVRNDFSGQHARLPVGFEAVLRRLEALEAQNLDHRIARLEADEIDHREDILQITQQQEYQKADSAALDALTLRIDELDLAMVRLRSEVWRGFDNEVIAMRERLGPVRDQSHESQLDSRELDTGGSRWSKRTPASSSSFALPPTDRPLRMMAEEAPPIWDIQPEQPTNAQPQSRDLSTAVPYSSSHSLTVLPHTVQPSRESTEGVSDSCLSKELRENTTGSCTTIYSNHFRSAVDLLRQLKGDV